MDLGLKDIGFTFIVGAITILGFELILFYFLNTNITGFFSGKIGLGVAPKKSKLNANTTGSNNQMESIIGTSGFLLLSFTIGIIVEDASYKFMDPDKIPIFEEWLSNIYPQRKKMDVASVHVLMNDCDKLIPNSLGKDLARVNAFTKGLYHPDSYKRDTINQIEQWFVNSNPESSPIRMWPKFNKSVEGAIKGLYYVAKNTVFLKENYYDELKRIQNRIDLSRSLLILSVIYFFISLPFAIIALFYKGSNRIPLRSYLIVYITFLSAWYFSNLAYRRESEEFNKRVFGYFSTMLLNERLFKSEGK
ncbi:hypothetical protein AHMF7605_21480 [Adhaeribacter arboris]|uniref:Uncharacterized protein n=1 Tax=Adhaeribacter arboris TaxID=2072846 RepID=A0A2T2YK58_9BACT|nr:hypothetical protein [Adhaeribacter arboris]PSR55888.1 hypothetical protein AHMF7605_21480 [Adhaeribacter arboris]